MKRKFTFLIAAAFMLLTMMATTGTMWGQSKTTTDVLTLDCATPAPTGSTSTALSGTADIATFLNSAAGLSNAENKITCSNKTGDVYKGKGSGGGNIPQQCLKVGKASGGGGFTFTIPENYDNIDVVEITCYGWKTSSSISINSGTAQTFSTAQVEVTKTFELASSTRTITISVTSSAVCITEIVLKKNDGTSPSISASNVEIAYDAEDGSIEYTLNNGTGNVEATITSGDWLELGTITANTVPFTCSANDGAQRTATVTLSFEGADDKVVTITQAQGPNAPGTQNNPYTVAQARAAIDAGTGTQGVYATGIVSAIVTPYGTNNYQNITFNMVDEAGDEVFLQAFRCVGDDAPNVAVNDIAVVYGNLTKYQTTYEFAQGCSVVSLEHPVVTDPYITASDVDITYNATGGNIAYTVENPVQGGQVTATTTSNWLTLGTDFASPIAFTCNANEAGERTATVTLTYTYGTKATVNKEVTVTQAGNPNVFDNISDITAINTNYKVRGTVVAINSRGFVMGDGTGYVYYYKGSSVDQTVNSKITLSGTTGTYGQIIQFTGTPTIAASETSNYDGNPAATVITAVPDYSTGYHLSTYLEFTGALEKSSSNYFITVGEGQIQISYPTSAQSSALTALDGKTVHVKGYFSGINSSSKFTVMLESAEEVAVPSITLEQYTYNLNADGGDAELHVTYTNMPANPQAVVIFYEANGTTPLTENPTWITASINNNGNIAGHIDVNEGDARSAYFKVKGIDGNNNEVYSDLVTINQAAAGPNIEFNNTSMTLAAGGESDRKLSFDYSGLGDNPTFSINYYEQDGTTAATYDHTWLTATIEGHKVNISAVANTGAERKAYFKVYGENGTVNTESNLVTITQAEAPTYAELPFAFDGGRAAIAETDGLYQDGLGSDYNNSPKLKFDGTGDWLLLQFNERPGTLTFKIKGNGYSNGSTSTFKVQTSADGTTYTDLATYTELGDTQTESFDNLDENVRYIKWIYTEKGATSGGNVALGDINLTAYAAPVASITVDPATVNVTAEGEDDGSLAIAYENLTITDPADFDIQYYDANNQPLSKDDKPDWMEASIIANSTQDGYVVSFSVDPNDGAARTAYFKVFAMGDQDFVYSNLVTVSQEAYVAPTATIAVTPETVNVEASGEDEGNLAIAYENLTITDPADFDIQYYDANNQPLSKDDKPDWMEASIIANSTQDGYVVSFSVDPNDGAARTAYFKVFAMGDQDFVYSNLVTINQAAYVVDYATLPFEWEGGTTTNFNALNGTSTYSVGDYGDNQGVYRMKLDADNDYIQIKTNEQPGIVTIGVKMIGGASTSTLTVQGSADGETFTNVEALTISGSQNDELTLTTTNDFAATDRYVRLLFTKGSNVGVGPITIAQVDHTPSITINPGPYNINCNGGNAELPVTTANLAENPQLAVVFCNSDGSTPASYNHDWISAEINTNGNVDGHISVNTGEARSAYFKVSGLAADNTTTVYSELVTINQAEYIPSIVFETASIDLAAGGETDRKISFDYSGLGDNPTFEVRRYESDGTTPAIYDWLTTTISGNKVKITVPANDGVARTAYFKVYGENGNVNTLSNLVTVNQAAHVDTYSLVTNVNQIVSGKHYIIANGKEGSVKVMAGQNSNNRASIDATASNQIISAVEGIYEFVINGPVDMNKNDEIISVYTIYDTNEASTGYLYAASSSANYLKTKGTLDNNGKWTIVIEDNDAATIKAQGSNSRNWMRNNGNLFSCYSTGQSAIYLYVKDNDNNLEYYGSEITYPENSIPDGGSIMVGAGSVVTVSNTFTNTDNASIIIEDGGQLVHENPVSATIQKNVTGYGSKSVSGWYLIASPVANLSVGCATTGSYDFFKYDEETYTWLNQKVTDNHITNFEQGIGYLYANSAATVIDYMGTLVGTNTKVTKAMSFACDNAGLKGFNLMGNPFSRNLVAGDMILNDTAVTTYYTIEGGSEFVARKISTNPIKPGQGFFVQASAEGQNLVFNPTAKGRNENNGYISIKAGNSEFTDNAFVQIANGNTLRKMTLSDNSSIVYVMNGGKDYAAARIDALEGSMPVCFKANKLGSYTITIEAKDIKTEYMHLIDKISHEDIDLLLDPSYTFIASDGDNASRFTLVFRAEGNANTTNDIFAYQNGDDIIVNGEGELQVFDVMGRMIATQHINGTETVNVNAIGVYIFKLNEKTQKIVVR